MTTNTEKRKGVKCTTYLVARHGHAARRVGGETHARDGGHVIDERVAVNRVLLRSALFAGLATAGTAAGRVQYPRAKA